jgi:hypothetical protein
VGNSPFRYCLIYRGCNCSCIFTQGLESTFLHFSGLDRSEQLVALPDPSSQVETMSNHTMKPSPGLPNSAIEFSVQSSHKVQCGIFFFRPGICWFFIRSSIFSFSKKKERKGNKTDYYI